MLPKNGTSVPPNDTAKGLAMIVAEALVSELGKSARAAKTLRSWTGASDREARYWLAGSRAPSGWNLILLARNSDAVMSTILKLTGRDDLQIAVGISVARASLLRAMEALDELRLNRAKPHR